MLRVAFAFFNRSDNSRYFHGICKSPGNDFSGIQVHDTVEIDKAILSPDICDVGTPDSIRPVRIELLIKDVVKLCTEIRIPGGRRPGFDLLGFDAHLFHVFSDSALRDDIAQLSKFFRDLRSSIVLLGIIIDLPDLLLDAFLTLP